MRRKEILEPGRMDREIILENPTESRESDGSITTTWVSLGTVWAEKDPNGGREYYAAGQVIGEDRTTYRIRYMSGVGYKTRVRIDTRVFDIVGIEELGRGIALDIDVKELRKD